MKVIKYISYLCLLVVLLAPVLYLMGTLSQELMKNLLLAGTGVWFITAATWINKGV